MKSCLTLLFAICFFTTNLPAQEKPKSIWDAKTFKGIKLRSIGPAFMSGRIADIAIHPNDENTWYIAVGSGGVWKTSNAGVTWKPIFDEQKSYSIGCVTIDPNQPNTIWVGTGENVGGRHVGYGDGIYQSKDGGASWKNMGLKNSEHISKIIVHPKNSDVIWVAAQGPLWKKGGDRGLYKTTDGGKTWKKTLGDDEWVGVTEIAIDAENPNNLFAATWQRHRTVAAYMGGGPGTGLYKSRDGGDSWEKLTTGLPKSNLGKIGLTISPQKSNVVYAAIELDRRKGQVFRSADGGISWKKMSNTVSGATGPHYYQELYACPHNFDRIYLADVRMQISDDGGKTFRYMKEKHKHSDNHALAFRKSDPDYLLAGTDGGLYESFDLAENWRFIANLPLTQFYKVAVDDAEPFYNIYGGSQDNSTETGPSRTDNVNGIQNSDWSEILDWDGHQSATEPGNPNIVYAERQEGTISRVDMITGEIIDIQPQPAADEGFERFNWDAPILVSPHSPTRIYFASQRVWRSDNRGDEWSAISGDLTRNQERLALPIMGKTQSWDNAWDISAMSNYNTITSLAESPIQEGLIYAGTDDGLIQVTEDGGENWRKIEVEALPNVPKTAFVNDIKADLYDANTLYVALDNHKYGDFKPYLLKSTDKGNTWKSIASNLSDRTLVWRLVQDHVKSNLLFIGTEFGIYFSVNGGERWTQLKGGVPTISFRDLAIQRRENDLVGASFGRSFYVLDNYAPLREVSEEQLKEEATLFPTRKAWWYIPRSKLSSEAGKGFHGGAQHFVAPNPPFGAVFTYYLKDDLKSKKAMRKEQEKKAKTSTFPGWDAIEAERMEATPKLWLTVKDSEGNVVRRIQGKTKKGFHRIAWDLRYPAADAVDLKPPAVKPLWWSEPRGILAAPGTYTVSLAKQVDGVITELSASQTFEVVPLRKGALKGAEMADVTAFWKRYQNAVRRSSAVNKTLSNILLKIKAMETALLRSQAPLGELDQKIHQMRMEIMKLDAELNGNPSKAEPGEKSNPTISGRLFSVNLGIYKSTYGPTKTHKMSMQIIEDQLAAIQQKLIPLKERLSALSKALTDSGAPWIEGDDLH